MTSQEGAFFMVWPVQDAKARFSELLDASLRDGPQVVTRRGVEAAVLVPIEEWRRLRGFGWLGEPGRWRLRAGRGLVGLGLAGLGGGGCSPGWLRFFGEGALVVRRWWVVWGLVAASYAPSEFAGASR